MVDVVVGKIPFCFVEMVDAVDQRRSKMLRPEVKLAWQELKTV